MKHDNIILVKLIRPLYVSVMNNKVSKSGVLYTYMIFAVLLKTHKNITVVNPFTLKIPFLNSKTMMRN